MVTLCIIPVRKTLQDCKKEYTQIMKLREKVKILGLSIKEEKVLMSVIDGFNTPLLISDNTNVSRPAVYEILKKLKKRGIVTTIIINGKKYWSLSRKEDIDRDLYEAKKVILSISEGSEEVKGLSDGAVVVIRGKEAVLKLITSIAKDYKNERLYAMQGDSVQKGWDDIVGLDKINDFNHSLRSNGVITEAILQNNWFEDHISNLGDKEGLLWAKGFNDRAHATYQIDKKYFNHAGQIFMFKNSLYLMAMNEALVVEIRNSELQKMIKQMFSFIEEHADKINVNQKLNDIIKNLEERESIV